VASCELWVSLAYWLLACWLAGCAWCCALHSCGCSALRGGDRAEDRQGAQVGPNDQLLAAGDLLTAVLGACQEARVYQLSAITCGEHCFHYAGW
jgi:hypothetical protein